MSFAEDALTQDALLGGRVPLWQPRQGYRAATDPVLLAAAVAARPGDRVLDAGCGVGAAALCLLARAPGVEAHGVELQPDYADLARRNGLAQVWLGDLAAPPGALAAIPFDWVLTNPPYFDAAAPPSPDQGRDIARRQEISLADWTRAALRRVRSGGRLAMIHLAEKLPEILGALDGAGDIAVLPLQPRVGRPAKRVLVTAKKGGRGPFRLAPPLTLHAGARHERDGEDFTEAAQAVLRDGAPLTF